MIVFDTNAVNKMTSESLRADIIRKLRESGHHRVAVPWIVFEELVAHRVRDYPAQHQSVLNALQKLNDGLPWEPKGFVEALDLERLQNHWRDAYKDIFEVIDTSGDVALKAMTREAMALPPAKRSKDHSEGARDAAIWFSILDFLDRNPDEHVCFVTANTKDFGDGTNYQYPMNEDLGDRGGRLTRLSSFEDVVAKFTNEVSGKEAEAAAEKLLRSAPVQSRFAHTSVDILSSATGYGGLGSSDDLVRWHSWLISPKAELLSVTDVIGHEIEEDTWYTAKTRWLLYGAANLGNHVGMISCAWDVKLLFSTSEDGQTPTLLFSGEPMPPDMTDERCVDALKKVKDKASSAARKMLSEPGFALRNLDLALWADAMPKLDVAGYFPTNLAQQWADAMPKLDVTGYFPTNLAQQWADAIPKLDVAGYFPTNLAQQWADAIPKLDVTGLASLAGSIGPSSVEKPEPDEDNESDENAEDSQ